jgi:Heterokaryon incompatibility protein (HET)
VFRGDQTNNRVDVEVTYLITTNEGVESTAFFQTTVGENLGSALRSLRKEEALCLWVDAICIDQDNSLEKTDQVQLMFQIYKVAEAVIVWLGPAGPYSNLAMETINNFGKEFARFYFRDFSELSDHGKQLKQVNRIQRPASLDLRVFFETLLTLDNPDDELGNSLMQFLDKFRAVMTRALYDSSTLLDALGEIWTRLWWTRVWIIQEYLAASQVRFVCGYAEASSEHLWLMHSFFGAFRDLCGIEATSEKYADPLEYISTIKPGENYAGTLLKLRHEQNYSQGLNLPLGKLLFMIHRFVAPDMRNSNPRDSIYSLLGLATDTFGIIPDYTRNEEEVFIQTSRAILTDEKRTELLQHCNPHDTASNLPSWAIDWTAFRWNHSHSQIYGVDAGCGRFSELWFTSKEPNNGANVDLRMYIRGVRVGCLSEATNRLGALKTVFCGSFGALNATANQKDHATEVKFWRQWIDSLSDLITRSSTGGRSEPLDVIAEIISDPHFNIPLTLSEVRQGLAALLEQECLQQNFIQSSELHTFCFYLHDVFMMQLPETRLFSTDNGLIGHILSPTRPGDILVIFYGCFLPIFLREVENGVFRLVCSALVPRILHGEFLDTNPEDEVFIIV